MHIRTWMTKLRKSVRTKKLFKLKSPRVAQVFAISLVALIAVTGLVLAAYQARPSKAATVDVQPAASQTEPVPATTTKKSTAHAATASAQAPERVTLTGCLEEHHDEYRLKDTSGTDAPKSRNWKTGFLTKHAATITIVDDKNRLKLGHHVGERVSVTGMLVEHELEGRSISRVALSCD